MEVIQQIISTHSNLDLDFKKDIFMLSVGIQQVNQSVNPKVTSTFTAWGYQQWLLDPVKSLRLIWLFIGANMKWSERMMKTVCGGGFV